MKERQILFSSPMVRAILDGRKTQTRRVVKDPDHFGCLTGDCPHWDKKLCADELALHSPYGAYGDRLWVRETWRDDFLPHENPDREGTHIGYLYRADPDEKDEKLRPWKPSIHMPRAACRLRLEVTGVRVERLQDISIADVDAEGLDSHSAAGITHAESKISPVPEHWIGGADEGLSYCRPCAEKEIKKLEAKNPGEEYTLDGGYRTDSDGQAFCETCHCQLDNSFTDYACGSELDHFEQYGFDVNNPSDCYSFQNILATSLWKGGEHSDRLRRLSYRALWDSLNAERGFGWAKNPWVWCVSFRRATT